MRRPHGKGRASGRRRRDDNGPEFAGKVNLYLLQEAMESIANFFSAVQSQQEVFLDTAEGGDRRGAGWDEGNGI